MKNFGKIKNKFSEVLIESIIKKNDTGKKTFGKFVKMLKENEILKTQYFIYDNIENKYFDNSGDAKDYIKESVSLLSKYKKKDIMEANKKLASLVTVKNVDYDSKGLHENITKLIFTGKSSKTLEGLLESMNTLRDHMTTERIDESSEFERVDLPPSVLSKMVVNKFNSKYEDISEGEKKIIKSILNGSEEDKQGVYVDLMRECIDTIDGKLNESKDNDVKGKLLSAKDKLLRMEYNKENYSSDISKVYQLKESIETE
jgi:hypothetical protein